MQLLSLYLPLVVSSRGLYGRANVQPDNTNPKVGLQLNIDHWNTTHCFNKLAWQLFSEERQREAGKIIQIKWAHTSLNYEMIIEIHDYFWVWGYGVFSFYYYILLIATEHNTLGTWISLLSATAPTASKEARKRHMSTDKEDGWVTATFID